MGLGGRHDSSLAANGETKWSKLVLHHIENSESWIQLATATYLTID